MNAEASDIKRCCARLYESELVVRVLGEAFHPGGEALTQRLVQLITLYADSRVADVASGIGTTAMLIGDQIGCSVIGIDFGPTNVARATAEATRRGLGDRVAFRTGDAERLPLDDESVDAVICECAFCTFPDKARAAHEFARVLKPGGRVGLSDITRLAGPAGELDDLAAWIACLADARPAATYAELLNDAGFEDIAIEAHDDALIDMIRRIGMRWLAVESLAGLRQIDLTGINLAAAKRLTQQALHAAQERRLGYALVTARVPAIRT